MVSDFIFDKKKVKLLVSIDKLLLQVQICYHHSPVLSFNFKFKKFSKIFIKLYLFY